MYKIFCLFGGYVPLENFLHSYGGVTITGERLQILSYTRHSLPLSSEGSLARHTCCDTGHPFKGHLRGPVYNGGLGRPMRLTPVAQLSLTVLTT